MTIYIKTKELIKLVKNHPEILSPLLNNDVDEVLVTDEDKIIFIQPASLDKIEGDII